MRKDPFITYIVIMSVFVLVCFLAWLDIAYHYFEDSHDMWYMDAYPTLTDFIITYIFWASFTITTGYLYTIRRKELNNAVKITQKIINKQI